jgi:hypothetical protein
MKELIAMDGVVWRPPGPPKRGPGKLFFVLLALKRRPGEWAEIGKYASVNAASATASRLQAHGTQRPDGDFEFTCRTRAGGGGVLFGRFRPPELNGE